MALTVSRKSQLKDGVRLLKRASYVVALTGAGISTPSGIPDFRSPESGLWSGHDPLDVASISGFRSHPDLFYEWIRPLAKRVLESRPNAAHFALSQLESYGSLRAVVTQNIDMLHSRAGSRTVYELHGHLRTATCMSCGRPHSGRALLTEFVATAEVPHCQYCDGVLKPDVILFGENLPWRIYNSAEQACLQADLVLVAGSSLAVAPANDLPRQALRSGAKLMIVNYTETPLDHLADVVIRGDVAEVLPSLVEQLGH